MTLTVAAEAEEGQETEQEAVIEKLLADAVITDTAPATTVFGETVKDDVVIEADDGYLQLQLNDNTVLVSTFSFNYDKNVFSKSSRWTHRSIRERAGQRDRVYPVCLYGK